MLRLAHRGLSAEVTENTLAAFQAARQAGADGIELDLRLSHDGHVVVMHDAALERTTDGNGRISDLDYDDIRDHETEDGPVPTLDEALKALADWPAYWNLEVKAWKAAAPVVALAVEHGIDKRCQLSSMDPHALQAAKDVDPDLERGLVVMGPPDPEDVQEARDMECTWLNLDQDFVDATLVDWLRNEGFKLGVWTVNDPVRALELVELGIDAIMTDERGVLESLAGE